MLRSGHSGVDTRCVRDVTPWASPPGWRGQTSVAGRLPLFLDLRGLPRAVAQVVELGSAHCALGDHLDLGDDRRVDGERALDADAEAELADSERLPHAGALAADHVALEHLDPLAVAFDDADMDLQVVAGREVGNVVTQALTVDQIGGVHGAVHSSAALRGG